MACIFLWSYAVRVHDSQAYRKMDVTRERISRILKLREIFLSFQTGFNLVNDADVCAILESISSLKPSLVIAELRYLKLVTVSSFCPFTLISVLMHSVLVFISLLWPFHLYFIPYILPKTLRILTLLFLKSFFCLFVFLFCFLCGTF